MYYFNTITEESSWEKPAGYQGSQDVIADHPIPLSTKQVGDTEWDEAVCLDGRKYYINRETKVRGPPGPGACVKMHMGTGMCLDGRKYYIHRKLRCRGWGPAPIVQKMHACEVWGGGSALLFLVLVCDAPSSGQLRILTKRLGPAHSPGQPPPDRRCNPPLILIHRFDLIMIIDGG